MVSTWILGDLEGGEGEEGGNDMGLYWAQSSWLLMGDFVELIGFDASLLWINCGCRT